MLEYKGDQKMSKSFKCCLFWGRRRSSTAKVFKEEGGGLETGAELGI